MNKMLEDVHRDAIRKFNSSAKDENRESLREAAARTLEMIKMASRYGKTILEGAAFGGGEAYIKNLLPLLSGGIDNLDYILETAAEEYRILDFQGIQAMIFYIYFRGIISILFEERFQLTVERCIPLLPEQIQMENGCVYLSFNYEENSLIELALQKKEKIKLDFEFLEKEREQKELKGKQIYQKFYAVYPIFHSPKLLEKLHELERELIENLSDESIDTILRQEDNRKNMINRCLYGLSNEARLKIFNCGYGEGFFEIKELSRMEFVLELGEQEEDEILGAVLMMLGTIKRLRRLGKIKYKYE